MRWFLFFSLILGGIGGWFYRDQLAAFVQTPAPSLVMQPVSNSGPTNGTIFATGFVEGITESVELRFEMAGRLEKLLVEEGDQVRKGDVLAVLDSSVLKQRVIQAEADLALAEAEQKRLENAARSETRQVAEAQVAVAQAEVKHLEDRATRIKRLFERKVCTEDEWMEVHFSLETAKARLAEQEALASEVKAPTRSDDLEVAKQKVEVARSRLDYAGVMLERVRLVAPMDGTVLQVQKRCGEMVDASDSEPVFVLANLDQIRVRVYVEEVQALAVHPGDAARVMVDGLKGKEFSGVVVSCSALMKQKKYRTHQPNEYLDVRTREAVIQLDNAQELVVGLPVDVIITPSKSEAVSDPVEVPRLTGLTRPEHTQSRTSNTVSPGA